MGTAGGGGGGGGTGVGTAVGPAVGGGGGTGVGTAVGETDAPGLAAEGPEMRELLGTALEQATSATRTARRAIGFDVLMEGTRANADRDDSRPGAPG